MLLLLDLSRRSLTPLGCPFLVTDLLPLLAASILTRAPLPLVLGLARGVTSMSFASLDEADDCQEVDWVLLLPPRRISCDPSEMPLT